LEYRFAHLELLGGFLRVDPALLAISRLRSGDSFSARALPPKLANSFTVISALLI
jgi:hypothetical protein